MSTPSVFIKQKRGERVAVTGPRGERIIVTIRKDAKGRPMLAVKAPKYYRVEREPDPEAEDEPRSEP